MSKQAYKEASHSGLYEKPKGLKGKYDNVRRFWEDESTRLFLKPHLERLIQDRARKGRKVRIMDLGCGCGDGYELLTGIRECSPGVEARERCILTDEKIEEYLGIDLSPELLAQGECLYQDNRRINFKKRDFSQGLGLKEAGPFDLFLANYGTLSHCEDRLAVGLLVEIARHSQQGTLVVGDWLGNYCYEWQDLWEKEPGEDHYIDYVISYIYEEKERENLDLDSFPLRLMDRKTLHEILQEAAQESGVTFRVREIFDRSLFVGRHVETGEYLSRPQPLRTMVNSLLEPGTWTDLDKLKIHYNPREEFSPVDDYFQDFASSWNTLVHHLQGLVDPGQKRNTPPWDTITPGYLYPGPPGSSLKKELETLQQLVRHSSRLPLEDARANIIEPQLAYMLRNMEINSQKGMGMGHGLGMVLEIEK